MLWAFLPTLDQKQDVRTTPAVTAEIGRDYLKGSMQALLCPAICPVEAGLNESKNAFSGAPTLHDACKHEQYLTLELEDRPCAQLDQQEQVR